MKNFFKHISLKYDDTTNKTMKMYCNEKKRLTQQQERLKFLLKCRDYGIIPKHTKNCTIKVIQLFECSLIKRTLEKTEHNFHKKILNLEISQANATIKSIRRKLFHIKHRMKTTIDDDDYTSFINKQEHRIKEITKNIRHTHQKKINTLKEIQFKKYGLIYNVDWFENKTNVEFPMESQWILSLGKKFSLPINKENFSSLHTIADLEHCLYNIEENDKEICRTKIATNITNFKRQIKNTEKEKCILTIYDKTIKFLKRHQEIIIIQSDKGNKTVAMYKEDYKNKIERLLEDKNTYKSIRIDPTSRLQKINNNIITDLYKNNQIDAQHKNLLYCTSATAPRLYGLPKVHKLGIPLRPIVSSINVPCYQLSKFIGSILQNLVSPEYNIKDSISLRKN